MASAIFQPGALPVNFIVHHPGQKWLTVSFLLLGVSTAAGMRLGEPETPSGHKCDDISWGTDSELGNPEMKRFLGACTEEVKLTREGLDKLPDYGCRTEFDVVSWYDIEGIHPDSRAEGTGGIYCAKLFKVKESEECLCGDGQGENKLTLYAGVSGKKGPKTTSIESVEKGYGLDMLQSNYTYFVAEHPRAWASRHLFRKGIGICRKWNALDTVIQLGLAGSAAASQMHIVVGPSDENAAPTCGKHEHYAKSKRLKALLCINPLSAYTTAIDMQAIAWEPPHPSVQEAKNGGAKICGKKKKEKAEKAKKMGIAKKLLGALKNPP